MFLACLRFLIDYKEAWRASGKRVGVYLLTEMGPIGKQVVHQKSTKNSIRRMALEGRDSTAPGPFFEHLG